VEFALPTAVHPNKGKMHMNSLSNFNVEQLIEQWYQQEQEGIQFPVPFDIAWQIVEYSTKGNAKRLLTAKKSHFVASEDYVINSDKSSPGGRSNDSIFLSCDTFKHFCLMSGTAQGRTIRQYFIECEKKWKLVQKHYSSIAEDIEILRLKEQQALIDKRIELAAIERDKEMAIASAKQADFNLVALRNTITKTCPDHIQQRILGYSEIKTIEYRDRIIKEDELINDASTVNKTWLCKRFGFMKNGRPDTKKLNAYLAEMPSEAFQLSAYIRENQEFKREYLELLEDLIENERQINLGE
jgi:phage anti-repressor protein